MRLFALSVVGRSTSRRLTVYPSGYQPSGHIYYPGTYVKEFDHLREGVLLFKDRLVESIKSVYGNADHMETKPQKWKEDRGLTWPELIPGRLIKRYKRFLADVELADGVVVTAHCPNSGSMTACSEPGRPVYLSWHDNPKRKLKYTWEIIQMPGSLVGVNTLIPNRLVKTSIENGCVAELAHYEKIRSEIQTSKGSRLDLLLTDSHGAKCFVEIKNCTLVDNGVACFPDAVTKRGHKHLKELERLHAEGHRCVMFYCIQRMDAESFRPADEIDRAYGETLREAHIAGGVEILVYDVWMDLKQIVLNRKIPFHL